MLVSAQEVMNPKEKAFAARITVASITLFSACAPIEETPTPRPTPTFTPEATPTPEVEPSPTVVERGIETIPREIGGVEGTDFLVAYKDEIQEGIQIDFPNGQRAFFLGVYPDLPGWEETTHFEEEYVLYRGSAGSPEEGERMVFLTAKPSSEKKDALPFYWTEQTFANPFGNLFYIEDGVIADTLEPFVVMEEDEVMVVFNREEGRYEIKDEQDEITRTIEVFDPYALPEVITPEIVDQYFVGITPEEAQRLFEETGKFALPFDPRGIEFSIHNLKDSFAGNEWSVLGFEIPPGTIVFTSFKVQLEVYPAAVVDPAGNWYRSVGIDFNDGSNLNFYFVDGEYLIPLGGARDIPPGTALFQVESTASAGTTGCNVCVDWWQGTESLEPSLDSLVTIDGRYAYILR